MSLQLFQNETKKWDKISSKNLLHDIVSIISSRRDSKLRYMKSMAASTLDIPAKITLASVINVFLKIYPDLW